MSNIKNVQPTCLNCVRFFLNQNLTREDKILLTREIQALCLEVNFNKLLNKQQQIKKLQFCTEYVTKKSFKGNFI